MDTRHHQLDAAIIVFESGLHGGYLINILLSRITASIKVVGIILALTVA